MQIDITQKLYGTNLIDKMATCFLNLNHTNGTGQLG
jgi:hypothetical protein